MKRHSCLEFPGHESRRTTFTADLFSKNCIIDSWNNLSTHRVSDETFERPCLKKISLQSSFCMQMKKISNYYKCQFIQWGLTCSRRIFTSLLGFTHNYQSIVYLNVPSIFEIIILIWNKMVCAFIWVLSVSHQRGQRMALSNIVSITGPIRVCIYLQKDLLFKISHSLTMQT